VAYARALLTSTPQGRCGYIDADLRDAPAILRQAARILDLTQPTAVLLLAILHFLPDADDPAGIVACLTAALAPGSFVVISHLTADLAPGQVTAGAAAYNALVPTGVVPRTHAQVSALFGGLPLVPPGVVPVTEWAASRQRPRRATGRPVRRHGPHPAPTRGRARRRPVVTGHPAPPPATPGAGDGRARSTYLNNGGNFTIKAAGTCTSTTSGAATATSTMATA